MSTIRASKAQQRFLQALEALAREQNHGVLLLPGGVVSIKSIEVRTENLSTLGAGPERHQGGTFHYTLRFTQIAPRRERGLPEGWDADTTADDIVDAEVIEDRQQPELPSPEKGRTDGHDANPGTPG